MQSLFGDTENLPDNVVIHSQNGNTETETGIMLVTINDSYPLPFNASDGQLTIAGIWGDNGGVITVLFTDIDILEAKWKKWNEPDEIAYKSLAGIQYMIYNHNLLAEITEFMQKYGHKGSLPYLHIEGEDSWECYRRPAKKHILEFLRTNYDIYSSKGDLVQEANTERREFELYIDLD